LVVIHVLSAVMGFGPTMAFGLLGPMAEKNPGPGGLALMEGMLAIEKRFVYPAAIVVQPVTGVLLIFARGWNHDFFSHTWLLIALGAYIYALIVSFGVLSPSLHGMVRLAKEGKAGTPEFVALAKRQKLGASTGVALILIIVMMVWKPGG